MENIYFYKALSIYYTDLFIIGRLEYQLFFFWLKIKREKNYLNKIYTHVTIKLVIQCEIRFVENIER